MAILTLTESDKARFWAKVKKTEACWEWTATKIPGGYGHFHLNGRMQKAHRISFTIANGSIDQGIEIDHRCHNHACVNPDHLRPATHKQNLENRSGATSRSKSGVRGVSWDKRKNKWVGLVFNNGKNHWVGQFNNLNEAETAVVAKRNSLFTHNLIDRQTA